VVEDRPHQLAVELGLGRGDVAALEDVLRAADGDVGLHLLHAGQLMIGGQLELLLRAALGHLAGDTGTLDVHHGGRAPLAGRPDERDDELLRDVVGVDEDILPLL